MSEDVVSRTSRKHQWIGIANEIRSRRETGAIHIDETDIANGICTVLQATASDRLRSAGKRIFLTMASAWVGGMGRAKT